MKTGDLIALGLTAVVLGVVAGQRRPKSTTQPDATRPDDTGRPDVTKPDVSRPDAVKPDAVKPDATIPTRGEVEVVFCKALNGCPLPLTPTSGVSAETAVIPFGAPVGLTAPLGAEAGYRHVEYPYFPIPLYGQPPAKTGWVLQSQLSRYPLDATGDLSAAQLYTLWQDTLKGAFAGTGPESVLAKQLYDRFATAARVEAAQSGLSSEQIFALREQAAQGFGPTSPVTTELHERYVAVSRGEIV